MFYRHEANCRVYGKVLTISLKLKLAGLSMIEEARETTTEPNKV